MTFNEKRTLNISASESKNAEYREKKYRKSESGTNKSTETKTEKKDYRVSSCRKSESGTNKSTETKSEKTDNRVNRYRKSQLSITRSVRTKFENIEHRTLKYRKSQQNHKNSIKRIIALSLIMILFTTSMPVNLMGGCLAALKQAFAAEERIDLVVINSLDDLVELSNKPAASYQYATITISPVNGSLDLSESNFKGLGSESYPFCGTIKYDNEVSGYIIIKTSLFNYLDQSAAVGSKQLPLRLSAYAASGIDMGKALLAENYTNINQAQPSDIYLAISSEIPDGKSSYSTFAGIIGTMESDTELTLGVHDNIIEGSSKAWALTQSGYFCRVMNEGASLTIASYVCKNGNNILDYTVQSANGYAGSLVGYMSSNSVLSISTWLTVKTTVTAALDAGGLVGRSESGAAIKISDSMTISAALTSTKGNAGGLLGSATNLVLETADEAINITSQTIKASGSHFAGGLIGYINIDDTYSAADKFLKVDLSDFYISGIVFSSASYAGGIFGKLSNESTGDEIIITDSGLQGKSISEFGTETRLSTSQSGVTNYGGLIGCYTAANLTAALNINSLRVESEYKTSKTVYAGLIGEVFNNSYVEINNADVCINGNLINSTYFGGLVAKSTGASLFNVGSIKISGKTTANGTYGGVIGSLTDGVLRLYGKTDLSGIAASSSTDVSYTYGQIVGTRTGSLIYALGTGSDYNEADGSGWTLVRDKLRRSISDVGTWGEVVRVDGSKLKENILASESTSAFDDDSNSLLEFDTKAHTVTVTGFSTADEGTTRYIFSVQNFAAIALAYQCTDKGALCFTESDISLSDSIYMNTDVDLTGTGIMGLLRDDGSLGAFSGIFDGGNHTLTMSVGEVYGTLSDGTVIDDDYVNAIIAADKNNNTVNAQGLGQVYLHKYIGLFAKTGDETSANGENAIKNLTITGKFSFGNTDGTGKGELFCGVISANQVGGSTLIENVTSDADISFNNGSKTSSMPNVYVGGMLANVTAETATDITFSKCTWSGGIYNYTGAYDYYLGGYIACIYDNGSEVAVTINDSAISGALIKSEMVCNTSKIGGLLAITKNNGNQKIKITANNLTLDNFTIANSPKSATGGFLGYDWHNVDFDIDGLTIKDSVLKTSNSNAGFGGLVYSAGGYWKVHDAGIVFTGSTTITGGSNDSNPSGLLVCRGDDYLEASAATLKDYAIYMEIGPDAYKIASTVTVNLKSGNYFDEIVGITEGTYGNGIVSIATDSEHSLIDQTDCNTYINQLKTVTGKTNPKTRYYYNLDAYRTLDGEVWADNIIEDAAVAAADNTTEDAAAAADNTTEDAAAAAADNTTEDAATIKNASNELLLWSVYQHCESNLKDYFLKATAETSYVTISGDVDLTGRSYYPVDYTGAVTINNATITFDYEKIEAVETSFSNKKLSSTNSQHYMMQTGLFLTLTSSSSVTASLNIKGEDGLTLKGNVGRYLKGNGSGALICGSANGAMDGTTTTRTFTFKVDSESKLVLDGIVISGGSTAAYAPLLINEIGSLSSITIANVSLENYSDGTKAATSLLGNVGSSSAQGIVLLFENVALGGIKAGSVFTNALFMESFAYSTSDSSSFATYNFYSTDKTDEITYGREISNNVQGINSNGRNPYDETNGTGQVWYFDTFGDSKAGSYITDGFTTAIDTDGGFANGKYLPYVHVSEEEGGKYYHEIDVNQQVVNITEGCGTYDDPYIINKDGQLETLAKFLLAGSISGWQIQLPYDIANGITIDSSNAENSTVSTSLATHNSGDTDYLYTSGNTWTTADNTSASLSANQTKAYLRNAYYLITDDITLKSTFYGLGGQDPTSNVFSGVIIGRKDDGTEPIVTIRSHNATGHSYFGGLIAYSGGSVVKDIIINFSDSDEVSVDEQMSENIEDTDTEADNVSVDEQTSDLAADGTTESASGVTIKLSAKEAGQDRDSQSFFGAVIGYVVGGDNIIDNVTVNGISSSDFSLEISGTDGGDNGTNSELTAVGAYVGLIGGNIESGGGVIFRNMKGASGFSGDDYEEESLYFYRNPYIGRVLDGYACVEGDYELDNTNKNYKITCLDDEADSLSVTTSGSTNTITVSSTNQLWLLSAIVNSGAGGMTGNGTYNSNAYKLGAVRTGSYTYVGVKDCDTNDVNYQNDISDCNYLGGLSSKDATIKANKKSYLVAKFATDGAKYITGGSKTYGFELLTDCDMTAYGNGFRGIGGSYQNNYEPTATANATSIIKRTIFLGGSVNGNNYVISYDRCLSQYSSEEGTIDSPGWWAQGIGLFPVINFNAKTAINNFTIQDSKVEINYYTRNSEGVIVKDDTFIGETGAGGFAGITANRGAELYAAISFYNVDTKSVSVKGARYSGGLIGIYGESYRTGTSRLMYFGSKFGDTTLEKCDYDDINITGDYAAGGYFGIYINVYRSLIVKGPVNCTNSNVTAAGDVCFDLYSKLKNDTSNIKSYAYGGAGGLFGCANAGSGNVYINSVSSNDEQSISFSGTTISASQYAYANDYGIGALSGTQTGNIYAYYVNTVDVTLMIDIDENYKGQFSNDTSYYFTPAAGGLIGYTRSKVELTKCNINNTKIKNAGYSGGFVGVDTSSLTMSECSLSDSVISTQNAGSYDGSAKAGGICAKAYGATTITDFTAVNASVLSDGSSGMIIGYTKNGVSFNVTNIDIKGSTVATAGDDTGAYFMNSNSNPGNKTSTKKSTSKAAGAAGMIIGSVCTESNNQNFADLKSLKGFNILIEDCIVGYSIDDENTIGVYTGEGTGIAYSELEGKDIAKYTAGGLGKLIGGAGSISEIKLTGITLKGEYYPFYENGYGDSNVGIEAGSSNYVIYADYSNVSSTDECNTSGYINSDATKTSASSPYVVVNSTGSMRVYSSSKDKTGTLLTGDSCNASVMESIISDAAMADDASPSKAYSLVYGHISEAAKKFTESTGVYKDKISSYIEAEESNSSEFSDEFDFNVLVIDSTDSDEITDLINSYVSIVTNCDQTGDDTDGKAARYTSVSIKTYKWQSDRFVAVSDSNKSMTYEDNKFKANGSNHDNMNSQFTLIDIRYASPTDSSKYYHVYIPVVVKKVLQFDFSVKMLSGSSTYTDIYDNSQTALLASYGEDFTAQLSYNYTWTVTEWNTYLAGGNTLWSYDKLVQLNTISITNSDLNADLKRSTTSYTLVDVNRLGVGDTYFTGTGEALTSDSDSDCVLNFDYLKSSNSEAFQSAYMCDLLNLSIKTDSKGVLKIIEGGEDNLVPPAGATLRQWDSEAGKFIYYGPKSDNEPSSTTLYTATILDENGDEYDNTKQNVTISEVYYLIINCAEGSDVYTRILSLGKDKITSEYADALPTKVRKPGKGETTKYYTLGDFFSVKDVTISTEAKNNTSVIELSENDYIDTYVSATVVVPDEYASIFKNYASAETGYFRFTIKMSDNSGNCVINPVSVSIEELYIGDELLNSSDYTGRLSNGNYTVTITSKKADEFQNKTVTAKLRFSYEDDADRIANQFPERTSEDSEAGISLSVDASMAYSINALDGTSMTGSAHDQTRYYREEIEVVGLTYNSYNTFSVDGNTSQLGINGREVTSDGGQMLYTLGMFDATKLSSLDTTDTTSKTYPAKLVCTLSLQKKADRDDGSTAYETVKIDDYIENIMVTSDGLSTDAYTEDGQCKFDIKLTKEQAEKLNSEQIELDISFFVKGDGRLEEVEDGQVYANYKVTLTAYLANSKGEELTEEARDYLIYTNAMIYTGILSVTDFEE